MSKKIIAVDINEVLRALAQQFDTMYRKEFETEDGEEVEAIYSYDFFKDYPFKDKTEEISYLNEDLPDDISPLDYQLDEEGNSKIDNLAFEKEYVEKTAEEVYKEFMYKDYCFEIFGAANKMYRQLDVDFEKFIKKYMDQYDIRIFSKENWFTIPPTLFFLSNMRSRIRTYHFLENIEDIFDIADIIITTDPALISGNKNGTKVVKLDRPYNTELKGENLKALFIKDLTDNEDFEKLIEYKKEVTEDGK